MLIELFAEALKNCQEYKREVTNEFWWKYLKGKLLWYDFRGPIKTNSRFAISVPKNAMQSVVDILNSKNIKVILAVDNKASSQSIIHINLSQMPQEIIDELRKYQEVSESIEQSALKYEKEFNKTVEINNEKVWEYITNAISRLNNVAIYQNNNTIYIRFSLDYTEYFSRSCYHGAMLNCLYEYDGLSSLSKIAKKDGITFVKYNPKTCVIELHGKI